MYYQLLDLHNLLSNCHMPSIWQIVLDSLPVQSDFPIWQALCVPSTFTTPGLALAISDQVPLGNHSVLEQHILRPIKILLEVVEPLYLIPNSFKTFLTNSYGRASGLLVCPLCIDFISKVLTLRKGSMSTTQGLLPLSTSSKMSSQLSVLVLTWSRYHYCPADVALGL